METTKLIVGLYFVLVLRFKCNWCVVVNMYISFVCSMTTVTLRFVCGCAFKYPVLNSWFGLKITTCFDLLLKNPFTFWFTCNSQECFKCIYQPKYQVVHYSFVILYPSLFERFYQPLFKSFFVFFWFFFKETL